MVTRKKVKNEEILQQALGGCGMKTSVSDGKHYTPDEIRFFFWGYKRNGILWAKKYYASIDRRDNWWAVDKEIVRDTVEETIEKWEMLNGTNLRT